MIDKLPDTQVVFEIEVLPIPRAYPAGIKLNLGDKIVILAKNAPAGAHKLMVSELPA